jgi:hypothetical protein
MAKKSGYNKAWLWIVIIVAIVFAGYLWFNFQSGVKLSPSEMSLNDFIRAASFEVLIENGELASADVSDEEILSTFEMSKSFLNSRQIGELSSYSDQDVIDVVRGSGRGREIVEEASSGQYGAMVAVWKSAQDNVLSDPYMSLICDSNPCESEDCYVCDPNVYDECKKIKGTCCLENGNKCVKGKEILCGEGVSDECNVDEDYAKDEESATLTQCLNNEPVCCTSENLPGGINLPG